MKKRKKICFVVSSVLTAKFFLRLHIEKLSEYYDVYLVGNFSSEDIDSISYFKTKEIKLIPIERKINIIKDINALFLLTAYYKKMKFDAVHSLAPKAGLLNVIAGFLARIKNRIHIFTGQVWHTKKGLMKFLLKNFDRVIVLFSSQLLTDSQAQKNYLIDNKIVSKNKIRVLGKGSISGVDLNRFKHNNKLKEKFKNQLKIPDDFIVFIYFGRINKDKGIYDLALAYKKLLTKHNKVFLLFIGYDEDNHISKIKNIINSDTHFGYYGATDKPEEIINIGDVFFLPSYREGFGTSVIEASATKLAVVCSDTYGLSEAMIENKTGLRHKVGNVNELFEIMNKFIKDKKIINEMGKEGVKYVQTNFDAHIISKHWVEFYNNLLK